jgi:hypothetical protein
MVAVFQQDLSRHVSSSHVDFKKVASSEVVQTGERQVSQDDLLRLVEGIVNVDDGTQRIVVENSEVIVTTPAIDHVVKMGHEIIPALVQVMKCDKLSFDTFTRCYSACDQILRKQKADLSVYWSGGCETKRKGRGVDRIFPRGQENEGEFRKRVVDDIVKKYAELEKK